MRMYFVRGFFQHVAPPRLALIEARFFAARRAAPRPLVSPMIAVTPAPLRSGSRPLGILYPRAMFSET